MVLGYPRCQLLAQCKSHKYPLLCLGNLALNEVSMFAISLTIYYFPCWKAIRPSVNMIYGKQTAVTGCLASCEILGTYVWRELVAWGVYPLSVQGVQYTFSLLQKTVPRLVLATGANLYTE